MKLDDMILVSVDDHIIEPPDVFERHLPKRWLERAPRLVLDPGSQMQPWQWEAGAAFAPFLNAVVTLPKSEWGFDPSSLREIRPGTYDVVGDPRGPLPRLPAAS
ncbi:MAG: hypothetical protein FJ144_01745 [Deltaproteobacteria bacterium]|nr:hypothetical protein [Deltaproteobacteria bacterium]